MKKENLKKILAIVLLLGVLVPVVVAAEPQINSPRITPNVVGTVPLAEPDIHEKLSEASTITAYNMKGTWGIYDTYKLGNFKALKRGNEVFGSIRYLLKDFVFYISLNPDKTFSGLVSFEGVQDISGEYLYREGKFVALWDMPGYEGWFAGTL